jgi:hypothetical protein
LDLTGPREVAGDIAGTRVNLRSYGADELCDYQGTVQDDPATRIEGSMECALDVSFHAAGRLIGTFTMTR